MADPKLVALADAVEELRLRKVTKRLLYYKPYEKQERFHDLGSIKRERLLSAGNQTGKTYCGANEAAMHLTGEYPDWWYGRRWDRPVRAWAGSKTGMLTRDGVQRYLMGEPGLASALGTGAIPREAIKDTSLARGVDALYDTIQIEHKTNGEVDGTSILRFKSYDQGREKWQAETLDFIWFDEEPDMDIYSEGITRITATKGMVYMTFTPLKGKSDVVLRYLNEPSPDRAVVYMEMNDAKHIPEAERASIIAGWPAHEREAREKGIPMLGEGRIFTYTEASLSEPAMQNIPAHWPGLWAVDFGTDHPFAATLMRWDRDADCLHYVAMVRMSGAMPIQHVAAMRPYGLEWPVAWPNDGNQRKTHEGQLMPLAKIYKSHGLKMLDVHATWPDGSDSVEPGVTEMAERMASNRWKVAAHLHEWFEEYREYHRDNGQIVKIRDDLLSASRYAMMMRRYARVAGWNDPRRKGTVAADVDFSVI